MDPNDSRTDLQADLPPDSPPDLPPNITSGGAVLAILTMLPDEASARTVASAVLQARVAACVNRMAPCESEYWWQGRIETAREWPLLIKTTRERYGELERVLRDAHPYEVPEIVALPVVAGMPAYLDWVGSEACAKQGGT